MIGGLLVFGVYTLVAFADGRVRLQELGLGKPNWLPMLGFALAGLVVMLTCSPLADWLATRGFDRPPTLESFLTPWLIAPIAAAVGVCIAALGAGAMHFYQGPHAMLIIAQLSVQFGIMFVVNGYNLWAVMLCHGMYDTIAFIRFARRKSKYSDLDEN